MRLATIPTPAVVACALALASSAAGAPQDGPESAKARAILREASALIPSIDMPQQASALANIAGRQVEVGDLEGALRTYRAAKKDTAGGALNVVASTIASHGNVSLALDLVSSAESRFRDSAYHAISMQLASDEHFDDALAVSRLIQDEAQVPLFVDLLMWINIRKRKAGDLPGAQDMLNEALAEVERERARSGADPYTIAGIYQTMASRLVESGDQEDASAMIERIDGVVAAVDDRGLKEQLVSLLSCAQATVGQFEAAIGSAEELSPGQWRDDAMATISLEQSKQGDAAGALAEAGEVDGDFLRNGSYRAVADGLAGSGNYELALSVVALIEDPGERAYGLAELALQQAEKDDPRAAMTVQLAADAALTAGGETKPFVFEFIAVTRGMLRDFGTAEEMIGRMKDADKVWPLWNLTEMLVHAGREAEAISLAECQSAPYPKAY
ncbi:MAG TPA: hypothetical protein VEK33_02465, partial [Terriglobales bacterium]|nr:hypothetical protein [Terriglobales bacterium]